LLTDRNDYSHGVFHLTRKKLKNKQMKILFPIVSLAFALFYCADANAQQEYTTTNYTHDLAPVKVSIAVLAIENILTPITAGILVEGHLNDKLFYNLQLRQGYLRNFMIPKDKLITTQKESKGTVFEVGADWSFSEKMESGNVKVTTSSSFDGTYLREKSFKAKCEVRKYWAISGGAMVYARPKYINSDSSQYIISGSEDIKAPQDQYTHFNQSTFGVYGGIAHRKIKKAIVKSDGWNYRVFYSTRFYAHLLVGSTTVGDIIYNGQTLPVDNAKQMPLGYRLGWQWDQMGVVSGIEFGKMPGVSLETPVEADELSKIFQNNPFLNFFRFTFHYSIFNGDKNYHMKSKK
jgi:hypothetical protein